MRVTLGAAVQIDQQLEISTVEETVTVTGETPVVDTKASPILPDIMPAIEFPGADSNVVWNDLSPRLGLNYDLRGDGRTVLRTS